MNKFPTSKFPSPLRSALLWLHLRFSLTHVSKRPIILFILIAGGRNAPNQKRCLHIQLRCLHTTKTFSIYWGWPRGCLGSRIGVPRPRAMEPLIAKTVQPGERRLGRCPGVTFLNVTLTPESPTAMVTGSDDGTVISITTRWFLRRTGASRRNRPRKEHRLSSLNRDM